MLPGHGKVSEAMMEVSRLREALAQAREEKAALEVRIARAGHDSPGIYNKRTQL